MPVIQGILLAAGSSRRFGSNKLMYPLTDGTPMSVLAARSLLGAVTNVTAVVRSKDRALIEVLNTEGLSVTCCESSYRGMGASLACGIKATQHAEAWIVALADMPYIRISTITAVYEALRGGASLAAPFYSGKRGHPVGIGGIFRKRLLELREDFGARWILDRYKCALRPIAVNDPGILQDIDTPANIG
jgi:molybdenum cofactor cytidylyltransferase